MKTIPLTQGYVAICDDEDYDDLARFKWYAVRNGRARDLVYAMRYGPSGNVRMHRQVMPGVDQIDHINGDGLDNRRSNLRPATPHQNLANARKHDGATSRYKGVSRAAAVRSEKPWRAQIRDNGRIIHLGMFSTELAAALVYDLAARTIFGPYARTNFAYRPA